MTGLHTTSGADALRELEDSIERHFRDQAGAPETSVSPEPASPPDAPKPSFRSRMQNRLPQARPAASAVWRRLRAPLRRATRIAVPIVLVLVLACGALWWRLNSGPVSLDIVTPWLREAIAGTLGAGRSVDVGGTQFERDASGAVALRLRDVVVRDPDGTVVASAPKAEIGISGAALLTGRLRAERISLVGAELAVRVESNGEITIFAGGDNRPIAEAMPKPAPPLPAGEPAASGEGGVGKPAAVGGGLARALGWIDQLTVNGLDGGALAEVGLKSGVLTVEDRRNGKRLSFSNIDLDLKRASGGGINFSLSSGDAANPWTLGAAVSAARSGRRVVGIDASRVPARNLLLALRLDEGQIESDLLLSARLRAELRSDGSIEDVDGRIAAVSEAGLPGAASFDRAEATLEWDPTRNALIAPMQVISGGSRVTLLTRLDVPANGDQPWAFSMAGGSIVLAPPADKAAAEAPESRSKTAAAARAEEPIIFNRIQLRFLYHPAARRLEIAQGDIGNLQFGLALSGAVEFGEEEPRLALGLAATRMPVAMLKRLWPAVVSPSLHSWVDRHVTAGTVEKIVVATNAPLSSFQNNSTPLPAEGLSVDVEGTGVIVTPVEGLPAISEADVTVKATARSAQVAVKRGTVEPSPGRKLTVSAGTFEASDIHMEYPPARVQFRVDGPMAAAADLLSQPYLRDTVGTAIDPATSRGTVSGQVNLGLRLNSEDSASQTYAMNLDFTNFAADKLLVGQKVESPLLRVQATHQGYVVRGDVKINGVAATMDYRRMRDAPDAEVRIAATLDEAARARVGLTVGDSLAGPVAVKMTGRIPPNEQNSKFAVDADFTQARVSDLLPGWQKPAGRPARATFTLSSRAQSTRIDDLIVEGAGMSVKGQAEFGNTGDVVSANFPTFSLSDGDRMQVRADRTAEGTLRLTVRGDVYDARSFLKSALAGRTGKTDHAAKPEDFELDVKLGTVAGHNGETLRGLDFKIARRGGVVRSFALNGRLGRDAAIQGDLRSRQNGRPTLYVETADAGALSRLTDTYGRIVGGQLWVAMDPPRGDGTSLNGLLNMRNFAVRGEAALDRVASGGGNAAGAGVGFDQLSLEFTKTDGRFSIREGLVRGPIIGATLEGNLNFEADEVRMRGTFVPLYGLNNMFGRIPIVGLFLGGASEGLVGITYEVSGSPGAPVLRVNPISAIAPGLLRKFFEFPSTTPSYAAPSR